MTYLLVLAILTGCFKINLDKRGNDNLQAGYNFRENQIEYFNSLHYFNRIQKHLLKIE